MRSQLEVAKNDVGLKIAQSIEKKIDIREVNKADLRGVTEQS